MKNRILSLVTCSLFAIGAVGVLEHTSLVAQESGKAAKAVKGEGTKKATKPGDRLPANYGQIGLSEDQKKKVYDIQNKYDDQLAALQKQIADLKAKEASEVEAVLTPDQVKALQAAKDESKKKAAEKKKAVEKEKGSEKTVNGDK